MNVDLNLETYLTGSGVTTSPLKFDRGRIITTPYLNEMMGRKIIVDEKNRVVVVENYFRKLVVKCDKDDKFDLKIGLGLALSHWHNFKKYRVMREFFRNKKRMLDYKKYANWVLLDYCNYNEKAVEDFIKNNVKIKKGK